jgi:hypothetical protein
MFLFSVPFTLHAGTIHDYRDTLGSSAPGLYSNHTIEFKTTVAIPAGGFVRFIPEDGNFTIPATDFDHENVELAVATSSGYVTRTATTTQSATEDGVTVITGTSGQIEVTLNTSVGIPQGARVRLRIGNHTALASSTLDLGILNPSATGTYAYFIEAGDSGTTARAKGLVAIIEQVTIPNVDTREFDPPVRFNGAPTGTISGTTQFVQMSLETDEFARCRYSNAPGIPYFSIGNEFTTNFTVVHAVTFAVATSTTYTFYIRCIDDEDNVNTDDYVITFTIPAFPEGVPGDDGDNEGEGSGTGSGSGDSDPGSGDPSGGDDTSGGSSGGGSGGGGGGGSGSSSGGDDGGGGFEGDGKPYQSGDGRVIINGYAFPRSTVSVLVDGAVAETAVADASGSFSVTIDEIARGSYTFGIYAVDRQNVRSSTFSTTFLVTGGRGSTLSNVNVMPSIKVTPDPVTPGQSLTISGYAIPSAVVTIENQRDKSTASLRTFTANSNSDGFWQTTLDTNGFQNGTYKVRARAEQQSGDLVKTNFSNYTFYGVGEAAAVPRSSDLNRDGKVNLIDFSILLFHWNTNGGNSNPPADINGDGRVSLTDFSIMIFNWTG